jgi:hypothetical protein
MITSSTSAALDPGALEAAGDGDFAELVGRHARQAPLNEPTGVRAAETMTTSVMGCASNDTGVYLRPALPFVRNSPRAATS